MKTRSSLLSFIAATTLTASANPESEAWISQNLINDDGQIITTETPLNQETGTMDTVPLEGILARFELWVYPVFSEDGSLEPQLVDQEVVGILPRMELSFSGLDPHDDPRTRADWSHEITYRFLDAPKSGPEVPNWFGEYLLRKRFLDEAHIGQDDAAQKWREFSAAPVQHTKTNQEVTFTDDAYPPDIPEEDRDKWSGIIEYSLVTGDVPGSPIPYLTVTTLQVRVWPKWHASFENFPAEEVTEIPDNLFANVYDIYPGTERVEVVYYYDEDSEGKLEELDAVTIVDEPWTAITDQDRRYSLAQLADEEEPGDYHVRVTCYLPGGLIEHADQFNPLFSEPLDPGEDVNTVITIDKPSLRIQGGVFSLE
ncbi:MAG: hypothetical protein Q7Q71_13445 [Verrucomicrobiota bacterium JB023]|nr:hypothetical protein [Verrucomicrobiota bacterium JB023]